MIDDLYYIHEEDLPKVKRDFTLEIKLESQESVLPKHVLLPIETINNYEFKESDIIYQQKGQQRLHYYNIPAAYDIETSSFKDNGRKVAITYSHVLNIDGHCFKTETWDDFSWAMNHVVENAGLDYKNRLIVYVHNLSYEFQFMKKHFTFVDVFMNGKERDILYAVTEDGIEFRCSMMLSGSNLAGMAKNLTKFKIKKMVGDLDYKLIRTPLTPLTEKELGYILNDVIIIEYFIREAIEESGTVAKIPLTNTGYVREFTRSRTINAEGKVGERYRQLMKELTLTSDEYRALRAAFAGGFTHANAKHVGIIMKCVTCLDLVSSYPSRCIAYQFPMGKGVEHNVTSAEDFENQLRDYACLFYVEFGFIVTKANESYISKSKTLELKKETVNNGRVVTAEKLGIWITDVDFRSIQLSYEWETIKIGTMYKYKRAYLPKEFIECIIKLYEDKTSLKDVQDMVAEYLRAKGMLNSLYGMCVQELVKSMYNWNDKWKSSDEEDIDMNEALSKNNKSRKRFLFYPWGVWITAYARFDLFEVIVQLGDDYVYSDTDSIYLLDYEKNKHIFDKSNEKIINLLTKAMNHHGLDPALLSPKDPEGRPRMIGVWNFDGYYKRFKTLGAKRYITEDEEGKINITVSGINKDHAVPYLKKEFGDQIFETFGEGLVVPAGYSGKSTHTYIDEAREGTIKDYLGTPYRYMELSGVHLEETHYNLTISDEYKELLDWVQNKRA